MKTYYILFFVLLGSLSSLAQDKLIIKQKSFGGPTLRRGDVTELVFKRKRDYFFTKRYFSIDSTIHFREKQLISVPRVDSFLNSKTSLLFKDLGFTIEDVKKAAKEEKINLLPQTLALLTPDFVLNFDSLNFCKSNLFEVLHGRSLCGRITTEVFYNKNRLFYYPDSEKDFDIKMYFKTYILIKDLNKVSQSLPEKHFSKKNALYRFIKYLDMLQCEDYYYRLYLKDNPPTDERAKNLRVGWNFEEYLKKIKRNSKN